jgi:hypothetical protein
VTRPDVLGIGFPRAGTTWLRSLLDQHPDVYLPRLVKELHFFDLYFDRGVRWYESQFAAARPGQRSIEISPSYVFSPQARSRIGAALPSARFIVMLRHPVSRIISGYQQRRQTQRLDLSIEQYVRANPELLDRMDYAAFLQGWIDDFGRESLHVEVLESATADASATLRRLSAFIGVPEHEVPDVSSIRANASFSPARPRLYAAAVAVQRGLRSVGAERVAMQLRRSPLRGAVDRGGARSGEVELPAALALELADRAEAATARLERQLRIDLSVWRAQRTS